MVCVPQIKVWPINYMFHIFASPPKLFPRHFPGSDFQRSPLPTHACPHCPALPSCHPLTSLSRLVPAAVVGLSSGLYGLKRLLNTSEIPRVDRPIPAGLGWPHPWNTYNYQVGRHQPVWLGYKNSWMWRVCMVSWSVLEGDDIFCIELFIAWVHFPGNAWMTVLMSNAG